MQRPAACVLFSALDATGAVKHLPADLAATQLPPVDQMRQINSGHCYNKVSEGKQGCQAITVQTMPNQCLGCITLQNKAEDVCLGVILGVCDSDLIWAGARQEEQGCWMIIPRTHLGRDLFLLSQHW